MDTIREIPFVEVDTTLSGAIGTSVIGQPIGNGLVSGRVGGLWSFKAGRQRSNWVASVDVELELDADQRKKRKRKRGKHSKIGKRKAKKEKDSPPTVLDADDDDILLPDEGPLPGEAGACPEIEFNLSSIPMEEK
ncbi:MAG: hypothetical protein GY822_04620 [Deltaproteobacteria bacterium]|nr:hypothetical protein [Deltaproteobacteria bacterium]